MSKDEYKEKSEIMSGEEPELLPDEMYKLFCLLWIHQDRLQWSRVNWMLTIQVGIVAGSFAKPGLPATILICIGTILLFLLERIFHKDKRDQSVATKMIDRYHEEHKFPFPEARILSEPVGFWGSARKCLQYGWTITILTNVFLFISNALYFAKELGYSHPITELALYAFWGK
jgi:hypothetical protein